MKILIFKGGGYDGCFWEWNALFFDQGKLHHKLLVSGRSGQEALEIVTKLGVYRGVRELIKSNFNSHSKEGTPFLIRTDDDWKYFFKEWNSGFALQVAKHADHECPCDRCKKSFPADEIVHTGYTGDGGIGIQYTDNKCHECADQEHDEFVAQDWPHLKLVQRLKAIQDARREGCDVSIFAARHTKMPPISGRFVYEPEFY